MVSFSARAINKRWPDRLEEDNKIHCHGCIEICFIPVICPASVHSRRSILKRATCDVGLSPDSLVITASLTIMSA